MQIILDPLSTSAYLALALSLLSLWKFVRYKKDLKEFADIVANDIKTLQASGDSLLRNTQRVLGELGDLHGRQNDIENRLTILENDEE